MKITIDLNYQKQLNSLPPWHNFYFQGFKAFDFQHGQDSGGEDGQRREIWSEVDTLQDDCLKTATYSVMDPVYFNPDMLSKKRIRNLLVSNLKFDISIFFLKIEYIQIVTEIINIFMIYGGLGGLLEKFGSRLTETTWSTTLRYIHQGK